ncbi:hypothetical protein LZ30DRAFT_690585 [Colletotrichum cereale]|nr:hypothetical protein LZ30DRAFT_690585 [Colletotrichum cereale]
MSHENAHPYRHCKAMVPSSTPRNLEQLRPTFASRCAACDAAKDRAGQHSPIANVQGKNSIPPHLELGLGDFSADTRKYSPSRKVNGETSNASLPVPGPAQYSHDLPLLGGDSANLSQAAPRRAPSSMMSILDRDLVRFPGTLAQSSLSAGAASPASVVDNVAHALALLVAVPALAVGLEDAIDPLVYRPSAATFVSPEHGGAAALVANMEAQVLAGEHGCHVDFVTHVVERDISCSNRFSEYSGSMFDPRYSHIWQINHRNGTPTPAVSCQDFGSLGPKEFSKFSWAS